MKELHELLDLCFEKGLTFSLSPELYLITIFRTVKGNVLFNYSSYYEGELLEYTNIQTLKLSDLIQKVKEYESK